MRTFALPNRRLPPPAIVTLVLLTVFAALVAGASAVSAQGTVPDAPEQPIGTAVFVGGVDLEWNDVPGADSYDVQLYRNGQWIDLPGGGVEIAFYGAGAIISGLDPDSTLWFQVRAKNAHGSSDWSNFSSLPSTSQFRLGRRARPDNVPASGAPVINGTAQVGESLTADTTGIEDGNGLDRVQFRFQWTTNDGSADTDIASATDSTYTLAASDEGKTIRVRVAFTDRGGYAESLTSSATATVAAAPNSPATGAPVISGTAEGGKTLTADTSDIADADGLSGATFTYQWIANDGSADTDIQDATDSTYTLVADDEGKTVKVRVSFTDDAENAETLTSTATNPVAARPNSAATGAPTINGTVQVGETLTADTAGIADTDGLTNVTFSYQWIRNDGNSDTDITSETDSTYTLVADDEGKTVKVRVSFTDDVAHEETLTSAATATVGAAPNNPATGTLSISGTAEVGETLAADTTDIADADGLNGVTFSYQWVANDGTADTDIADATASTYTLVSADEGRTIKVRVSFTDDDGYAESLTSTATEAVSYATQQQTSNSPATGAATISGTTQVGETLTADTSDIADADGLNGVTFGYQWVANDGTADTDITDATASTYTLVSADEGKTIKVRVSFTDDAANEESLTSAATGAVAAAPSSYITVAVTEDSSDPDNIVTNFTVTWSDSDDCSTNYNIYLAVSPSGNDAEISRTHLGSAASGSTQATPAISFRGQPFHPTLELYCGAYDAGSSQNVLVASTELFRWNFVGLREGTYSSAPLTALTISSGTLSPDFDRGIYSYAAELPSDVEVITLDPAVLTGYQTDFVKNPSRYRLSVCRLSAYCDYYYGDGITTGIALSDADTNTYGFQVDLDRGENRLGISVNGGSRGPGPPKFYSLTVTVQNSPATVQNSPATGQPTISGTAQVGETLTVDTSGISDVDGLDSVSFSYQWLSSRDTDITGATDATHILAASDEGKTIKVRVSFTDDAGDGESLTSTATATVTARPNTPAAGALIISGTAEVGETLSADTSGIVDTDGLNNVSFSYQWIRNDGNSDTDITSETESTYILVADDEGKTIKVRVTFTDDAGDGESLTSTATATVTARPNTPATGAPIISGTAQVGETLTADTSGISDVDGLDSVSFSYQWLSSSDTDIAGATDATHILAASDEGRTIKVRVSFTDDDGYAESLTSTATEAVSYATQQQTSNSPATGAATISGTTQVGETLTADTSDIADADGLNGVTFGYQWVANDGTADTDITDATASTYTLVSADEGKTIKVRVSFTDDAANEESLTSAATGAVAAAPSSYITVAVTEDSSDPDNIVTNFTVTWSDSDDCSTNYNIYLAVSPSGNDAEISRTHLGSAASGSTQATPAISFRGQPFHPTLELYCGAYDAGSSQNVLVASTELFRWNFVGLREGTYSSAPLTALTISSGTLSPDFDRGIYSYAAELPSDVEVITLDPAVLTGYQTDFVKNPSRYRLSVCRLSAYCDYYYGDGITTGIALSDADTNTYGFQVDLDRGENRLGISVNGGSRGPGPPKFYSLTVTVQNSPATVQNSPATGQPTISGTAQVGETLTVDTSGISDVDGLDSVSFSYQWLSSRDTDITGATDATHILAASDEGKTIKVRVSFTDDAGDGESLTSTATATVTARPNTPAAGALIISGTAEVGETLSADTSGIVDTDGLNNVSFSYQWIRNDGNSDTDITSETESTYILVADDEGKTIKVRVTFTDDAGDGESLTSTATATVTARPNTPATGAPIISGTAQVGETLTADTSGISDVDGLDSVSFSYQWLSSSDTDIAGATDATHILAASDEGKTIKVRVSFTDDAANEETLTSAATAEVVAAAPTEPAGRPRNLTGTANADGTVTLRWDAPNDDSVTGYQILRRRPREGESTFLVHVNDTGSTATEYTDNDVTHDVLHTYRVKAINAVGLSRQSNFVGVTPTLPAEPAQNSPATGAPTISGTAQVAETLTADTTGIGDADGLGNVTFSYQWLANDVAIQGETGSGYTLASSDAGKTIKVTVSFTDDAGNPESLTSVATPAVTDTAPTERPPAPENLTAVENAGGSVTLTWDAPGDDSVTGYQILRREPAAGENSVSVYVADTGSAATSFTDTDVAAGTKYVYRVKAINDAGVGPQSGRVLITTND